MLRDEWQVLGHRAGADRAERRVAGLGARQLRDQRQVARARRARRAWRLRVHRVPTSVSTISK